jgi:3-hydroxybutyrate dehydrogenase
LNQKTCWITLSNELSLPPGFLALPRRIPAMRRGFGLLGLTRAIALETASDGMAEQGLSPKAAAQVPLQTKQPMHRCTTPKGIAALRLFLCGAEAATLTGAALAMDGAWTST